MFYDMPAICEQSITFDNWKIDSDDLGSITWIKDKSMDLDSHDILVVICHEPGPS